MTIFHPDEAVRQRLLSWDVNSKAISAARQLFPTFDELDRFMQEAYLAQRNQAGVQLYREFLANEGTGRLRMERITLAWVGGDLHFAQQLGVQPTEVSLYARYLTDMEDSVFRRRGRRKQGLEGRTLASVQSVWRIYRLLGLERVERMKTRGTHIFHEASTAGILHLIKQGVDAEYISSVSIKWSPAARSLHAYSLDEAVLLYRAGVPADYASVFERMYGDRLAVFAISFWEAGVPAEYGLQAFDAVHSIDGAIQMWKDGISLEYLTALTEF